MLEAIKKGNTIIKAQLYRHTNNIIFIFTESGPRLIQSSSCAMGYVDGGNILDILNKKKDNQIAKLILNLEKFYNKEIGFQTIYNFLFTISRSFWA